MGSRVWAKASTKVCRYVASAAISALMSGTRRVNETIRPDLQFFCTLRDINECLASMLRSTTGVKASLQASDRRNSCMVSPLANSWIMGRSKLPLPKKCSSMSVHSGAICTFSVVSRQPQPSPSVATTSTGASLAYHPVEWDKAFTRCIWTICTSTITHFLIHIFGTWTRNCGSRSSLSRNVLS